MPDEIKNYDLVVLGGGPAGITAATAATICGRSAAIVNNHPELGGAGINTGTVPSKTLRETALSLSGLRSRNLYGVDLSVRRKVTVADFLGHEKNVKTAFNQSLAERFHGFKTDVYNGLGAFVDPHTVSVQTQNPDGTPGEVITIRGEKVLIGTGSSPVRPALFPFDKGEIYDSDSTLTLDRIPESLAVVGAGVIGSEYACTFAALGSKVHIIDGRDVLLPFLDEEVSCALAKAMEGHGILFHWKEKVTSCAVPETGGVSLGLSSGATLNVDAVLVAAGRKSNTEVLNLGAAGVTVGERGIISVDENYRTNIPHIYAAGDVIGFPALASTSMEQARRAVRHAFNLPASPLSHLLPNGIYTIPEVSMVGETEETLKKKGIPYVVGRSAYADSARGRIIGDTTGFIKLLFSRSDLKLLGIHIMGEQATDIIHIGLMVMLTGGTAEIFSEACFNTPTLGILYKTAALEAIRNASAPPPSEF
jgi:NAD(P) transhydrogenase